MGWSSWAGLGWAGPGRVGLAPGESLGWTSPSTGADEELLVWGKNRLESETQGPVRTLSLTGSGSVGTVESPRLLFPLSSLGIMTYSLLANLKVVLGLD